MHKQVKRWELPADELEKQINEILQTDGTEEMATLYDDSMKNFEADTILNGTIINIIGEDVIVDVGYKSEGSVGLDEFDNRSEVAIGDVIEVLLEAAEDDSGLIVLSKKKAARIRGWEKVISTHKEGDVVRGRAIRKIKGGLLVDIGVPVFLPASQVGIRRTADVSEYIDTELECKIIKIDEVRRNIVVSRRLLLEEKRETEKNALLTEIKVGDTRKGVVKNIADFGAFVDLGGIDGLLHITDMSWGRISHPTEMVKIDEDVEVKIISLDLDNERIGLGLKQLTPSPWDGVEAQFPVGSRVLGTVVNLTSYGAFVRLIEGVEGLVHISEMSWTRRLNHPSELLSIGEEIDCMILSINKDKQEISLGLKQVSENPWETVESKYPPGTVIAGKVRNLTNYGAFIEIEEGIDGLLHVSDMSWTKKVNHPGELLKKNDTVEVVVLSVDREKKRVALGMKQLARDPWEQDIPSRYESGDVVNGIVTKITSFGVFVQLEEGLEGLLHISEISEHKVQDPEAVLQVGQGVEVKVLRVESGARKIGLSLRRAEGLSQEAASADTATETPAATEEAAVAESDAAPTDAPAETPAVAEEAAASDANVAPVEAPVETPVVAEEAAAPEAETTPTDAPAESPAEEPDAGTADASPTE